MVRQSVCCLLLLFPFFLFSQQKIIEKANLAYKYKQFAEAAKLYEAAIAQKNNPSSTLHLKTKLAYCYRMNNKTDRAEKLYAEIVGDERAKSKTYFYYGETLMCNGKYEEAKKWFRDYLILEPNDKEAALLLANCDKIKSIRPYFPYVEIKPFAHNSNADDNAPVAWKNGIVFSSDRKQGIKLMKEKSGWTGRDYLDLYFSALNEDGSYAPPRRFSAKLSEINKNTGNASFSADGKEVFFTRNDNVLNKRKTYNLQLYHSVDGGNGRWKKAEKLPFCSPNYSFMHPAISPNGQELFFATNRKGEGGTDLWVSHRHNGAWSKPQNLGPAVNTPANEGFPFVDQNGRLYFCSKGHPGYGGFDIFFTEKDENGQWKTPQNLGPPINSPLDDISIYLHADGKSGLFTSSRDGGDDDIYFFQALDQPPPEQTLTGIVPISNDDPGPFVNKKPPANQAPPTAQPQTPTPTDIPQQKEELLPEPPAAPELPIEQQSNTSPDAPKEGATSQSGNIFFEIPQKEEQTLPQNPGPQTTTRFQPNTEMATANSLFSFDEFMQGAMQRNLKAGQVFRLDGAVFDPNIWQLTPRVAKRLDDLIAVMRRYPSLQVELSAHTSTPGPASHNLELSKNRVNMALEYIIKEGIAANRIKAVGQGESQPLNHCIDGVACSMEEHLFNQRLEVRILNGIQ